MLGCKAILASGLSFPRRKAGNNYIRYSPALPLWKEKEEKEKKVLRVLIFSLHFLGPLCANLTLASYLSVRCVLCL